MGTFHLKNLTTFRAIAVFVVLNKLIATCKYIEHPYLNNR